MNKLEHKKLYTITLFYFNIALICIQIYLISNLVIHEIYIFTITALVILFISIPIAFENYKLTYNKSSFVHKKISTIHVNILKILFCTLSTLLLVSIKGIIFY